ncbi:MAG: hypothetical protein GY810_29335 [Aureispira sp.]|nr:hypothetical protein [Aureispira sp.]
MSRRKNNKKSFSDGLESVFEHTLFEDNLQDNPSMFAGEQSSEPTTKGKKSKKTKSSKGAKGSNSKDKKSYRKSFSTDLESFFKESIEDAMEGMVTEIKRNIVKKSNNKRAIGIDVLLRRTTDTTPEDKLPTAKPNTKRITFVLETEQIDQFKAIAKEKKKRLKQIIAKLIDEYIDDQQNEQ